MTITPPPDSDVDDPDLGLTDRDRAYERALRAEPRLVPVVRVVDAICALVRDDDTCCHACVWEMIVKPLVKPWIGSGRGRIPATAPDTPRDSWAPVDLAPFGRKLKPTTAANVQVRRGENQKVVPADTDTEKWLRSSAAFDAVTDVLIDRLYTADPGHGHGIRRGHDHDGDDAV